MKKLIISFVLSVCFGLIACCIEYKEPKSWENNIQTIGTITFWGFVILSAGIRISEYYQGANLYTICLQAVSTAMEWLGICLSIAASIIKNKNKRKGD